MLRRVSHLVPHLRSFLVHQCHGNHAIHLRALRRRLILGVGRAARHGVWWRNGRGRRLRRHRIISSPATRMARRRAWGRWGSISRRRRWHDHNVFHRSLRVNQARDPRLDGLNAVPDVQGSDVSFKYFAHLLQNATGRTLVERVDTGTDELALTSWISFISEGAIRSLCFKLYFSIHVLTTSSCRCPFILSCESTM